MMYLNNFFNVTGAVNAAYNWWSPQPEPNTVDTWIEAIRALGNSPILKKLWESEMFQQVLSSIAFSAFGGVMYQLRSRALSKEPEQKLLAKLRDLNIGNDKISKLKTPDQKAFILSITKDGDQGPILQSTVDQLKLLSEDAFEAFSKQSPDQRAAYAVASKDGERAQLIELYRKEGSAPTLTGNLINKAGDVTFQTTVKLVTKGDITLKDAGEVINKMLLVADTTRAIKPSDISKTLKDIGLVAAIPGDSIPNGTKIFVPMKEIASKKPAPVSKPEPKATIASISHNDVLERQRKMEEEREAQMKMEALMTGQYKSLQFKK